MLTQISSGIHYIWIIYLKERFSASSLDIGLFFAVSGAVVVFVQGYLIKSLIPIRLTEESASVLCLLLSCVQVLWIFHVSLLIHMFYSQYYLVILKLLFFGLCPSMIGFYVVVVLFAPASIYSPALKALLSNAAGATKQGELQGALSGLRTISAGLGALLFSWVYSFSGGAIANAAHVSCWIIIVVIQWYLLRVVFISQKSHNGLTPTTSLSVTSEGMDIPEKFSSFSKMMTLSSSFIVSSLNHDSSYSGLCINLPCSASSYFTFSSRLILQST